VPPSHFTFIKRQPLRHSSHFVTIKPTTVDIRPKSHGNQIKAKGRVGEDSLERYSTSACPCMMLGEVAVEKQHSANFYFLIKHEFLVAAEKFIESFASTIRFRKIRCCSSSRRELEHREKN
jgi:hypothetical protein